MAGHPSRSFVVLALALVVMALGVRIAAAVASFDTPLAFDPRDYDRYARSIASGHGYPEAFAAYGGPTAYRPPGFPAFLSVIYAIRGGAHRPPPFRAYLGRYQPDQHQVNAGRIGQALVGTIAVVLIGLIAYLLWGARPAIAALAIGALYPPLVVLGISLYSEPLFIVFVLAAVYAALRSRTTGGHPLRWAVASGALAGLAWLTRSNGFVILPALALLVWTGRPRITRHALLAPLTLLVATVLVIAPWTIRNASALHAFVPVSDEAGYTLAGTYNATSAKNSDYLAGWIPAEGDSHNARVMRRAKSDIGLSRLMQHTALEYARAHPTYVAEVAYCNTMRMIFLEHLGCGRAGFGARNYKYETRVGDVTVAIAMAGFVVLVLLAAVGATRPPARLVPRTLWLVPLLLASAALVVSGNRLRAPLEPFMILLGAVTLASAPPWFRSRRRSGSAPGPPR